MVDQQLSLESWDIEAFDEGFSWVSDRGIFTTTEGQNL